MFKGYASIKRCQSFLWKEDIDESSVQTVTTGSESFVKISFKDNLEDKLCSNFDFGISIL